MINVLSTALTLFAQATPAPAANPLGNTGVFMILMLVMIWFVMIRPQRNKQKEAEALQKALAPGDEVVTIGGAHGVITTVHEKTVTVRVAEGKVEFDRSAIATRLVPSTVEAK